jgi:hypothetical protein
MGSSSGRVWEYNGHHLYDSMHAAHGKVATAPGDFTGILGEHHHHFADATHQGYVDATTAHLLLSRITEPCLDLDSTSIVASYFDFSDPQLLHQTTTQSPQPSSRSFSAPTTSPRSSCGRGREEAARDGATR